MNPLAVLSQIQSAYRTYVHTFWTFENPAIRNWVAERVEKGTLLWRDPYLQLSRSFEAGLPLAQLVAESLLHPDSPFCFTAQPGDRRLRPSSPTSTSPTPSAPSSVRLPRTRRRGQE